MKTEEKNGEHKPLVKDLSWNGNFQGHYTLQTVPGYQICYATHPQQPNFSGHSRGRALHYRKAGQRLTLCNMRFDHAADKSTQEGGACSGKVCRVCVPKMIAIVQKAGIQ